MPKITKAWVVSLNDKGLEKIVAFSIYNRQATLLSIETDDWFRSMFDGTKTDNDKGEIFTGFFIPYYKLWVSMLYVVHEGLLELEIEDKTLDKIRNRIDMSLLRRFRNATFHFQPQFRSPKHYDMIDKHGFNFQWELWERQDHLVRRMLSYVEYNPHADKPTK